MIIVYLLGDIFTTGVIFESFIGNTQYSGHEVLYIHDIGFCHKIDSNNAFNSMYTLWFARYCRDLCGFGCMGELCGFVVARIM